MGTWRMAVGLAVRQGDEGRWSQFAIDAAMLIDRTHGTVPEATRVLDDIENECRLMSARPHLRAVAG